ncbi:MAG: 16S rRNA (cytosine(1402)-N(4))-methyltransferase RsmH [Candidatus Nealsonbacteria bacterium]|nr:16S rRNA (cytosine(1402)-N(4))-methyltransferase RsmH [Candidatus Nealsonbacteria bacterium]
MHIPVLQKEVIEYLDIQPNENFVDCTFGEGGHSAVMLENNGPNGKVLGIEADEELIGNAKYGNRLILVNDSYANLKKIVEKYNFQPIQGILLDLGMSSWHLEKSGRGFSFQRDEPLDMRYSLQNRLTAETIVNFWSKTETERILKEYGEERFARQIVERIVEERKRKQIKTTFSLLEIIREAVPGWYKRRKIHFATKTFQALRIAVNDELNNLKYALPQALEILDSGGKLLVISFHSLEDKIVKEFFKNNSKEGKIKILTKKTVKPSFEEVKHNPRSRSAKLRAAQKI